MKKQSHAHKDVQTKTVVITILAIILTVILIALYLAFPQIDANRRLSKLCDTLEDGKYDYIVLSQLRPYTDGSVEQLTQDFELKLGEDDEKALVEKISEMRDGFSADGYSIVETGFWDIKITVFTEDERLYVYVAEDCVYITEKYRRFNFKCSDGSLYELVTNIRDASYID